MTSAVKHWEIQDSSEELSSNRIKNDLDRISQSRKVLYKDPVSGSWMTGQVERWGRDFAVISANRNNFWCPTEGLKLLSE